jgi:RHH-type proline utilization regulon transcriptional repressor/proline dehydrogenase/delta 1-pyrroline-5-carboxylate dehydrogenase
MSSAFYSAGQRCSALRVLFIQQDISQKVKTMLAGAMRELRVGDPINLASDIGPVIDFAAQQELQKHAERMQNEATLVYQSNLSKDLEKGSYFAPRAFEIESLKMLDQENFGPILHIVSYQRDHLDKVIEDINGTGYGLTLGIHSRMDSTASYIQQRVHAGNAYVNRNMIGAVVGVQPFGGEGLSGTGPKAGGPHYLLRLCHERTLSINTTASGGNATLLSLEAE